MSDTNVTIDIVVIRVADGKTYKCAATVQATEEWTNTSPCFFAIGLSKKALKMLMPRYANVSKTMLKENLVGERVMPERRQ